MKKSTKMVWLALLFALIKNIEVPDGWKITYGHFQNPYYLNNLIYFLGNDLMVLCLSIAVDIHSKTIISKVFVGLALGKILDEFTNPFGYSLPELIWDFIILIWAIVKWSKKVKDI